MRQRSAVSTSMDKPRSVSRAGETATRVAARTIRNAANAARSRAAFMSGSRSSARWEAQQPTDHRRLAVLGLGVDFESELAAAERRRVKPAAPQAHVGLGKIVEATVNQCLVDINREALVGALGGLDDEGATFAAAHLGNLDDRRQRVDRRFEGGVLQAERGCSAGIGLLGAELHVAAVAGH